MKMNFLWNTKKAAENLLANSATVTLFCLNTLSEAAPILDTSGSESLTAKPTPSETPEPGDSNSIIDSDWFTPVAITCAGVLVIGTACIARKMCLGSQKGEQEPLIAPPSPVGSHHSNSSSGLR